MVSHVLNSDGTVSENLSVYFQEELPLDHEPSLDHWAKIIAEGEMVVLTGITNMNEHGCHWMPNIIIVMYKGIENV